MSGKVIVLWSGGIDSTAVLYHYLLKTKKDVGALFVNWQQGDVVYRSEQQAIQTIMQIGRKEHHEPFKRFMGLRKVSVDLSVFSDKSYVPARNTSLLALAYNNAHVEGADTVAIGISIPDHKEDTPRYPDCTKTWLRRMRALFKTEGEFIDYDVSVEAPFVGTRKSDVIKWCQDSMVPLYATFSCNSPQMDEEGHGVPCGVCSGCRSRVI